MKIIVDTREQKGLEEDFIGMPFVSAIINRKLDVGDYGCRYENNYEVPAYFERKSISDLFGTMTSGYARFRREMQRAKSSKSKLILLIEGSYHTVQQGYSRSSVDGITILRKLHMLQVKYDLDWHILDRKYHAEYIYEYYSAIGRLMKGKKK